MVRVHDILTPDNTPFLHTHPFHYCSLIISGGYTEVYEKDGELHTVNRRRFSLAFRKNTTPHRIVSVLPNTRTLFFTWSTIKGTEQGWTVKRHPEIETPSTYGDMPDGIYEHGDGFRKRDDGIWYALCNDEDAAMECERLSLHQHIPPDDVTPLNIPPWPGTKYYENIIKAGCGGHRDYWGDFDCSFDYPWGCDDCPILVDKHKDDDEDPESKYIYLISEKTDNK